MRMKMKGVISTLLVCIIMTGLVGPVVYASEITEDSVQAVITQLEAIDSLEQMQAKRGEYSVKNKYYDTGTTSSTVIEEHETARANYEAYISKMFAARIAAQEAYAALSAEQKSQIDASLVAKLDDELETSFKGGTFSVTPGDDEYTFEAVRGGTGYGYEVSNYMVSGNITQTFILVDTSDGKTSWTPNGKYVYGESNYEVTYCCDVLTGLEYTTDYKRVNLEDSDYYGTEASKHIRAILQNSYPYVTIEEMKASLKKGGLGAEFVDGLNRADIISAVQMAVWSYANAVDMNGEALGYFASIDVPKNNGIYFTPLHDFQNELWDWLPGKGQRSYDAEAAYRVNNLAHYLCNLPGVEAAKDEIVISDVKIARADLVLGSDDTYSVGMYVYLNEGGSANDKLKISATSYAADGTVTGNTNYELDGKTEYGLSVRAKFGDTIKVVVEGTQYLGKGVYFYEPKGGRDTSQSLVGVGEGETKVRAEQEFIFNAETEMGLRVYKTEANSGNPISDITFNVYRVDTEESIGESPTDEDVAEYATEANRVGSIVTDATGYGSLGLEKGTYLVVEEHNAEKVEAPVEPFYISIPMPVEKVNGDGTVVIEVVDIVSVYPKNNLVDTPEPPPIIPPVPDDVKGRFAIVKHDVDDTSMVLEGAKFKVYRPATETDTDTETIECDGVKYIVVPVEVNGSQLILETGADGKASSPELDYGTYFLVETEAPAGYSKLEEAVDVAVTSIVVENVKITYIANEKYSILPETGGIGRNLFYTIGGIMVLVTTVMFVTKKRINMY